MAVSITTPNTATNNALRIITLGMIALDEMHSLFSIQINDTVLRFVFRHSKELFCYDECIYV
jgi:hypothetical protein